MNMIKKKDKDRIKIFFIPQTSTNAYYILDILCLLCTQSTVSIFSIQRI